MLIEVSEWGEKVGPKGQEKGLKRIEMDIFPYIGD